MATSTTPSSSHSLLLPPPSFSLRKTSTFSLLTPTSKPRRLTTSISAKKRDSEPITEKKQEPKKQESKVEEYEEVEVEEDLPWIQEKALDLVEFTGSVTQAIPGPRVGNSKLPWFLAIPMAYIGVTLVVAFVKTVRKFNSPKQKRRNLVNKNAAVCISIDELFQKGSDQVQHSALVELVEKSGFVMEEIIRKYIRYALNEKNFNPETVANLIQLRKASMLDDSKVADILNEISTRIVGDKGPVVMDLSGYSEKGMRRKRAVQALFGKLFYLSELPEFCSKDSSLIIKEIFGVTDDDADELRVHALSDAGGIESLEKLVENSDSDSEDSEKGPSS